MLCRKNSLSDEDGQVGKIKGVWEYLYRKACFLFRLSTSDANVTESKGSSDKVSPKRGLWRTVMNRMSVVDRTFYCTHGDHQAQKRLITGARNYSKILFSGFAYSLSEAVRPETGLA